MTSFDLYRVKRFPKTCVFTSTILKRAINLPMLFFGCQHRSVQSSSSPKPQISRGKVLTVLAHLGTQSMSGVHVVFPLGRINRCEGCRFLVPKFHPEAVHEAVRWLGRMPVSNNATVPRTTRRQVFVLAIVRLLLILVIKLKATWDLLAPPIAKDTADPIVVRAVRQACSLYRHSLETESGC